MTGMSLDLQAMFGQCICITFQSFGQFHNKKNTKNRQYRITKCRCSSSAATHHLLASVKNKEAVCQHPRLHKMDKPSNSCQDIKEDFPPGTKNVFNNCRDSVWSNMWTDWLTDWLTDWHAASVTLHHYRPQTASLWRVWRWPPSMSWRPFPSGPGSIRARGLPRYTRGPSSPTPSLLRCTAAGRWQREPKERLRQAEKDENKNKRCK